MSVSEETRDLRASARGVQEDAGLDGRRQAVAETLAGLVDRRERAQERQTRRGLVRRGLVIADVVALVLALAAAHVAVPGAGLRSAVLASLVVLPGWLALAALYGLYDSDRMRADKSTLDDFWPIFHALTVGAWGGFALYHLTGIIDASLGRAVVFWVLALATIPLARMLARVALRRRVAYRQNALVVGAGIVGQDIARKLRRTPEYGLDVVGFVDADPLPLHPEVSDVPILGATEDLAEIVERYGVDHVVLAFTGDGHEVGLDVVRACNDLDVQVDIVPRLFEVVGSRAQFYSLQGTPLLGLTLPSLGASHRMVKRAMDIAGAAFGLTLLAPLLLAVAAAIKLTSSGPVFFRQTRIGKGQRPFTILKFRTMVADAEARKAEVAHLNAHLSTGDARMFKIPDDPRITRVGAILRKTSIDELPQLLNVLKGDMSLVGPRPLIVDEHRYVNDWGLRRLDLTPGLTGLWQVSGRSEVPFSQMLVLDYLYVTNWSLWGDIKLVFKTVPALLGSGRGAS